MLLFAEPLVLSKHFSFLLEHHTMGLTVKTLHRGIIFILIIYENFKKNNLHSYDYSRFILHIGFLYSI